MVANALIKKTGLYFIGNMASKCMSALIIPIYAAYVSSEALGEYDYLLTLCSLFCPVVFCAMWEAILKFALPGNRSYAENDVLRCAMQFMLCVCAVISLLLFFAVWRFGTSPRNSLILMLMVLSNGLSTVWQYSARALGKTKCYVTSGVVGSVANFAMLLIFVCLIRGQFFGLAFAYIVGQISILVYLELRLHVVNRAWRGEYNSRLMRKMLRYCLPCIFNLLSMSLLTGVGRLLIVNAYGPEANGQYAFAMKFASIITAIGSIFSMAVIEEGIIRERLGALRVFYSELMNRLVKLLLSLATLALLIIGAFYALASRIEYYHSFPLIPIIVAYAVTIVLSTNFGSSFMAQGKTEVNMWSTFVGLTICFVSSVLLMPRFEVIGVSVGLLAGAMAMMLFRAVFSVRGIGYKINLWLVLALSTAYFTMAGICLFQYFYGFNLLISIIALLLACAMIPMALSGLKEIASISDAKPRLSK